MPGRVLWIVMSVVVIVGLVAWSTTCTGPRPIPTGETLPSEGVTTTTLAGMAGTVPVTLAPPPV